MEWKLTPPRGIKLEAFSHPASPLQPPVTGTFSVQWPSGLPCQNEVLCTAPQDDLEGKTGQPTSLPLPRYPAAVTTCLLAERSLAVP